MMISVRITRKENAKFYGVDLDAVVQVPFEDYVAGVVASEVGSPHIEAAKAQAVAARTHAWPYYIGGKTISDSSATNQAFRAPRIDEKLYPNAMRGAYETAGQVLMYKGKVITTCAYSSDNGGRTVSSEERWGGFRAWLISQPDPWDVAEGVTKKTGHGVGMSQRGMKYAAKVGVPYLDILAFYYPQTVVGKPGDRKEVPSMSEKANAVVECAKSHLGAPYVFGAWGGKCTPSYRKQYAKLSPSHEADITKKCQVLSGKAKDCTGCKYEGKIASDCRGFTYRVLLDAAGIELEGAGATSQYNNDKNWVAKGPIAQMPKSIVSCVFKRDSKDVMQHTGLHIGNEDIIHCSVDVQTGKTTDKGWTDYAIPAGLYTADELAKAGVAAQNVVRETVKKGSTGASVMALQLALAQLRYDVGKADGIFGSQTAAALRCFQSDHDLTIDAVCGAKTWAAITEAVEQMQEAPADDIVDSDLIQQVDDQMTRDLILTQIDLIQADLDKLKQLVGGD